MDGRLIEENRSVTTEGRENRWRENPQNVVVYIDKFSVIRY